MSNYSQTPSDEYLRLQRLVSEKHEEQQELEAREGRRRALLFAREQVSARQHRTDTHGQPDRRWYMGQNADTISRPIPVRGALDLTTEEFEEIYGPMPTPGIDLTPEEYDELEILLGLQPPRDTYTSSTHRGERHANLRPDTTMGWDTLINTLIDTLMATLHG
jgi:hypothetical protein